MRKLQVSIFSHAADNSPQAKNFFLHEFLEDLRDPEISEDPPTEEGAQKLKVRAAAWSPATFRSGQRKNENVQSISMLVYDIDGKEKRGIDPGSLLKRLNSFCFALHGTTRSGFCPEGTGKFRLILPLARDVSVEEYLRLWDRYREILELGDDVDTTRRHPGGIFFVPVIFAEHRERYVFQHKPGPFLPVDGSFPSLREHDEKYWLETIRTAQNKHEALNKAAYAAAAARKRTGKDPAGLADLCLDALRENTVSEPVLDWSAARRTAENAVQDGLEAAEEDPLERQKTFSSPALVETAKKRLAKAVKDLKAGKDPNTVSREIGRFVHALEGVDVYKELEAGWKKCLDSPLSATEFVSAVQTGLALGQADPAGIHEEWKRGLRMNKDGTFFDHKQANVQILVQDHPALFELVSHNVRTGLTMLQTLPPWRELRKGENFPQQLSEAEALFVGPWVTRELNVASISADQAMVALQHKAEANTIDPLLEYFERIPKAEKVELLERVLIEAVGAEDTKYSRLISKWWFTSIYARQVKPGTKVDYSIILSGFQGQGKSSFFSSLFPDDLKDVCFTDSIPDWTSKECHISLSRFAVVELPELASLTKKSIEAVKAFMTSQAGYERAAWRKELAHYPRRAVFGGSTNEAEEFLIDHTGNRRFWPIKTNKIDLEWIRTHRDQIWAEARLVYETEKCWWPQTEEEKALCVVEQKAVEATEPFQEELEILLRNPISAEDFYPEGAEALAKNRADDLYGVKRPKIELHKEQKITQQFEFIFTLQIFKYLGLDEKSTLHKLQVKRAMSRIGWKPIKKEWKTTQLRGWKNPNE